ncbi:DUF6929 family protein [Gelidibacter maritimus]|uniref:DUF3616 domain-containing protein n=1 Tax=Gelidibacter maritimus TaxID=2761487 RepID=A0A7W2R350_9FLAO|nr:hypothetical protein [Gelidibacter maritimus]MBA6152486.1 hypothetical protein [Gelidibacter maritimus]
MQHLKLHIEILSWQILEDIPSASGIVKFKDGYYVIGDDSPYLFHLGKNFDLVSKTPIFSSEKLEGTIIPKINKPDFEAMEMISTTEILVFGSGSKSPERDVCVLIEIGDEASYQEYDISLFYDHIREMDIMQGYELDIEALARVGDLLYLFNRGRNIIFSFSLREFLAYCKTKSSFPIPKTHLFSLPKIKGLQAGFSGATSFQDQPYLIFTASVEDTPNAYDDGDILGSYLGIIKMKNGQLDNDHVFQQIPNPESPLKVESVIIDKVISDTETELVLVTDNDGAPSEILRLRMILDKDQHKYQ